MRAFLSAILRVFEAFIHHKTVKTIVGFIGAVLTLYIAYRALPSDAPQPPANPPAATAHEKSGSVTTPQASAVTAPLSTPVAQTPELKPEEWIPLSREGRINIRGIGFWYTTYAKVHSRPASATVQVDGKDVIVQEGRSANIIGSNGRSCVLKGRGITKEDLEFNLTCYD